MTEEESLREEIEKLKAENEKMTMLLKQIFYEKTGFPFICGFIGPTDQMGLPEGVMICPTYGADHRCTVAYKRIDKNE